MKAFAEVCVFFILLVLSGFVSLLTSHVVLSLSGLYGLEFITSLGLLKIFGVNYIIGIVSAKMDSDTKNETAWDALGSSTFKLFKRVLFLLMSWGCGWGFHWLFTSLSIS